MNHPGIASNDGPLQQAREYLFNSRGDEQDAIFRHYGAIGPDLVQEFLAITEQASLLAGDPIALRKRLFNILVEGLENIHHHAGSVLNSTAGVALFNTIEGYVLLFGNGMPVVTATMLEHRIELLNVMEGDDLKEHYMKLLSNTARTENGGAGLGLLTMARKCTRPMTFHTTSVDELTVYGILELKLARPVR